MAGLYTDYHWNLERTHCPIAYVEPTIDSDGNVYPCHLFTNEPMSMGNVDDTPFLDIWFGERFQAFRRMLASQEGSCPSVTAAASSQKPEGESGRGKKWTMG